MHPTFILKITPIFKTLINAVSMHYIMIIYIHIYLQNSAHFIQTIDWNIALFKRESCKINLNTKIQVQISYSNNNRRKGLPL